MLIESSEHFQEELTRYGLKGTAYKRAPVAKEMNTITLDSKNLYRHWINTDDATVEANFDKKHRQATLNISEEPIRITRRVVLSDWRLGRIFHGGNKKFDAHSDVDVKKRIKNIETNAKQHFTVEATGRRIVSSRLVNPQRVEDYLMKRPGAEPAIQAVNVEVTARFPKRETNLLIGFDEVAQFICMLPEKADSVTHAHNILKPDELSSKKGVKRQGEWFFIPATSDEVKRIEAKLKKDANTFRHGPLNGRNFNDISSHRGSYVLLDKDRYAIGPILDRRKNRHDPLILSSWHKIVKNNEVEVKSSQRTRYWD